jgi:hypothetical protein
LLLEVEAAQQMLTWEAVVVQVVYLLEPRLLLQEKLIQQQLEQVELEELVLMSLVLVVEAMVEMA